MKFANCLSLVTTVYCACAHSVKSSPTVHVLNGTYVGRYSSDFHQDFFLGIPFAQQPVGNLRFRVPQSLNETWNGTKEAVAYSPSCPGYGFDSERYTFSEACLTLNIVRPASSPAGANLPIGVWIYGGAFATGSSADERYNLTFLVDHATKMGKPFIGISINYRVAVWGFLNGAEVRGSGNNNIGLRDQRLALHWIQENIVGFGGDPSKVTIWGESAGAFSVGYQMAAFGGRDDKLFRGGIMQSGSLILTMNSTAAQQSYDYLVMATNCSDEADTLQCLREVPFDAINGAVNSTTSTEIFNAYFPTVDGDLVKNYGSLSMDAGEIVKVPILIGANAEEDTSFGPTGLNTTDEFYDYLLSLPPAQGMVSHVPSIARKLLNLYPDIPSLGVPAFLGNERISTLGMQWRRSSAYVGDEFQQAPRRKVCETWSSWSVPAYCFRFDSWGALTNWPFGAGHGQEVPFVFKNLEGTGYGAQNPFNSTNIHLATNLRKLSTTMATMWVNFIVDLNPNGGYAKRPWPKYKQGGENLMVLDANFTSGFTILRDDYRKEALEYINSIPSAYFR